MLRKEAREDALFDIGSNPGPCPGAGLCKNKLTFHTIYALPASPSKQPVLLGDMETYTSMSGYRFRLAPPGKGAEGSSSSNHAGSNSSNNHDGKRHGHGGANNAGDDKGDAVRDVIVVVGEPGEVVPVTYLVPHAESPSGWLLKEVHVTVASDGRKRFRMA